MAPIGSVSGHPVDHRWPLESSSQSSQERNQNEYNTKIARAVDATILFSNYHH